MAEPGADPTAAWSVRRRFLLRLFPAIMLPMFISISDQTMIATALPAIAADLGNVTLVPWAVVAYLVAAAVATPVYGRLGDLAGRRRMLVLSLSVVIGGAAICIAAGSLPALIAGRFIQGLGGGGLMALSLALVGELVPARDRGRYHGYLATVNICASTLGPLIGGLLTEHLGWRYLMAAPAVLALGALVLLRRLETAQVPSGRPGMDVPGILLFAGFVVPFILAMNGIRTPQISGLAQSAGWLALAALALGLLWRVERRVRVPLFQLEVIARPGISRSAVIAFCHGAAMMGTVTITPLHLSIQHGLAPTGIAFYLMTLTIGLALSSIVTGQLVSRTGRVGIFPSVGLTALGPAIVLFALYGGLAPGYWLAVWYAAFAICFGTVMNVLQLTVQVAAGGANLGAASGVLQMSRTLGAATGASVVTAVFFAVLARSGLQGDVSVLAALDGSAPGAGFSTAFQAAHLTIAVFVAVGAVFAWFMPIRQLDDA